MNCGIVILVLALACSAAAQTSGRIFLVRHAEKESQATDTPLSLAGKQRADCLAATIKDNVIATVITSEFQRTQQTAAPVVSAGDITPKVIPAADVASTAHSAKESAATGNVLVVAHSNTIPDILARLGVPKASVNDSEYDRLFIVTLGSNPTLTAVRYCPAMPAMK
jgi:broad specificity phosphatase PhoE